ncbi:MAG: FimV/HubP family polar landmark protein [Rubrivivax sp.]
MQSVLGEPLKAQVLVTGLAPAEQASLQVRLASPEIHRSAGLVFDEVLSSTRATLVRQTDGASVVLLMSQRPVGNVYVDVILEARWAAGQRLLGYTLLVSPEGAPPPAPLVSALASDARDASVSPAQTDVTAGLAGSHVVRFGETLTALAQQYRPEGVSLDQMLVALYRANPQAFMGGNMNRLKAGAVLNLPGAATARAEPPVPARALIEAHSADFGAYRQRLAGKVRDAATEPSSSRQASGQVQARVRDRKADDAAAAADQLKLSQGGVKAASSPEVDLSRRAEAREAAMREAELARNVQALKQLQQMAGASTVVAGSQAPASSAAPALEAASVPVAGPTLAAKPAAAASIAAAASAASAALDHADTPAGWLERVLGSVYTVSTAAALVLLMALWGGYRLWRGRRDAEEESPAQQEEQAGPMPELEPVLQDDQARFADELAELERLDPLAAADVHLGNGDDARAVAVLRAAIGREPDLVGLRVKLLDVLAVQRDSMSFEEQALQVRDMTGGKGPTWDRVSALGRELDPFNVTYGGKEVDLTGFEQPEGPGEPAFDAQGMPIEREERDLEGFGDGDAPGMPALDPVPAPAPAPELDLSGFGDGQEEARPDNLDFGPSEAAEAPVEPEYEDVKPESFSIELGEPIERETPELDLGTASDYERTAVEAPPPVDLGDQPAPFDVGDATRRAAPPNADPTLDRKMSLAKEFLEIGDLEGARDLLDEVYSQATGKLKDSARLLLDTLE